MAYLNPINHMSIKTHYITIIPIITENKNDLSSIKVKYFLRQDKNFTNIDFGIEEQLHLIIKNTIQL
jgi:hypothetical protein